MIKAIALDDEPLALEIIGSFCNLTNSIELEKTFTKAADAMKYLSEFPVDLLFLDINMPSISGIDFKKKISPEIMVIFTTAYSEFAIEGFNLNAVDYLLKPFTPERFIQAIEKARVYYQFLHQNPVNKLDHILIRVDYSLLKVSITDIVFIESLDDYLKIHLLNQKPIVVRMTMKTISQKLPKHNFIRVHRSFIVSLGRINSVRGKLITIGGSEVPIGANYETDFFAAFGKV